MPLICKRKMPRRTIDISSEESEGNSTNSETDTCTGSDEDYHTDEVSNVSALFFFKLWEMHYIMFVFLFAGFRSAQYIWI